MTHITGLTVTIGSFVRQRCGWCGEIIQDDDTRTMMSMDGKGPGSFEPGVLVRKEELANKTHYTRVLSEDLPEDCCYYKERGVAKLIEGGR